MKIPEGILREVYTVTVETGRILTHVYTHTHVQSRKSAGHLSCARQTALRNTRRTRSKKEHCEIKARSSRHAIVRKIDPAEKLAGWLSQINRLAGRRGSLTASRKWARE